MTTTLLKSLHFQNTTHNQFQIPNLGLASEEEKSIRQRANQMWSAWGRSSPTVRAASSPRPSFRCSSFKDIQRLCSDDDPTSPRKPDNRLPARNGKKIFHRVRVVSSLLRNWPTRPEHLAPISVPSTSNRLPETPRITIAGADTRIVLYHTSIRAIRDTFAACREVKSILAGFKVTIDERDVAMDSGFLDEVEKILGIEREKLTLPAVFVGGRYVGGANEVVQMHEIGELKKLVEGLPASEDRGCDGCGGYRFVVCVECNGSRKVYGEKAGFRACTACNENGLIKCSACYPTALVSA